MRHKPVLIFAKLVLLICLAQAHAFSIDELNYSFATYLGTGIYKVTDREVQTYQIPFSYEFDPSERHQWQLTLRAPMTIGFYDFDSSEILNTGLPDSVATFSFVPGIEALYPVKDNWLLGPFLDAGFASNQETDDVNNIYGAGVVSIYEHQTNDLTITLANRFLYAKDTGSNIQQADDFSSFETVVDILFPATLKQRDYAIDFSLYYANYRYFDNLDFLRPNQRPVEVVIQNEVGITFGLKHAVKYKYLDIPRLGIGYRFGDELSIVRIIIGSSF